MKYSLKLWLAGVCVSLMTLSAAAHAELITTNQMLTNPNFAGKSTVGWTTSGNIVFSADTIEGQVYDTLYSKSSSHAARQNIMLSADVFNTSLIDSGQLQYDASVWQRGYSGDSDRGRLILYFFDADNQLIQNATLGYRDPSTITKTTLTGYVPASTRYVQYAIEGVRYAGTDNNAVFAKNSLTFSAERESLALFGGYFLKGEQVIPVEPPPPTDVTAPAFASLFLILTLGGLRRKRKN